ncbi:glycerate kinase type-2 family protein [Caldivirga maquilingensis]|uniref:Hydroxypyruvate reductase n=1 Tax=Caldivirga maquilingensis (strain ATCC 700844 / DSM 13496 / JCM 10307 / IC-167) TaxID=397948 RepID=A8MCZ5_CALMQ|nr:glycerate kinase [Caldivirga maquilingensis]ABW01651.1 Hydroxypyruvate reductase [Caldivirga maquilingensis IC-167]
MQANDSSELRDLALRLVNQALTASDPAPVVRNCVRQVGSSINVCGREFNVRDIAVVAIGKAAPRLIDGALSSVNATRALAVIPRDWVKPKSSNVEVIESTHPLPSDLSIKAAEEIIELSRTLSRGDLALILISGGGSALVELPRPPLTIDDLVELNRLMLNSGMSISEINTVRKHVSMIKGGQLAQYFIKRGVRVVGLYVSDVPGDDPSLIASGPTVPDKSSFSDAVSILKARGIWGSLPDKVKVLLENGVRGSIPETPKRLKAMNKVILTNLNVLKSLRLRLSELGVKSIILTSRLEGEAREVGKALASITLDSLRRGLLLKRGVVLAGGEPTVTVRGNGRGGRTMELAAAFAKSVSGHGSVALLALATDGIDGNTDAAGAYADYTTESRAMSIGLSIDDALSRNDTYTLFKALNDTIITGPTGTQVNTIIAMLINAKITHQVQ